MSLNTRFKLITKHKNKTFEFNSDPLRHLIKSCEDEDRRVLSKINSGTSTTNVLNIGKW